MIERLMTPSAGLTGSFVHLEPLSLSHLDGLASAASVDRASFQYTTVPEGRDAMRRYVEIALALAAVGAAAPFATIDARTGNVLGSTRFANLEHVQARVVGDGSTDDDVLVRGAAVEIGWTWLTPSAQRTAINTEAKLLMLTHAFDVWKLGRVVLKTNEKNARSRAAIERLGATLDGVVQGHLPGGVRREAALYSLVVADWPETRARLSEALRIAAVA